MKLGQFLQFMFSTKIWPVKVRSDGSFGFNLLNKVTLFTFAFFFAAFPIVIYYVGPGLLLVNYAKLSNTILVLLTIGPMFSGSFMPLALVAAFTHFDSTIFKFTSSFTLGSVFSFFAAFVFAVLMFVLSQMKLLEFPTEGEWFEQLAFWISLIFVDIFSMSGIISYMVFLSVCCLLLKEKIENTNSNLNNLTAEHLKEVTKLAKVVNSALNMSLPLLFLLFQIAIIIGVYLVVAVQDSLPYHALCFLALNLLVICNFLINIDECYSLASQLASLAREQSSSCKSISEMVRIQAAVTELELCFPFSAMGYFTIEKSTLTSLAANTLTYLIVLVQFNME